MKLDGLGIFVHDMPTMIRFYRDVLGFEIQEPEDTINVYLFVLQIDTTKMGVLKWQKKHSL